MQDACAGVGTCVDDVRLCAGKPWAYDQLGLVEEDVEAEMVAVEAYAPGSAGRGLPEDDEVVAKFVAHFGTVDELA